MHEMLTLQHLFAGDSDLGTVKQIMEMEIPRPSANRTDVPDALERIVMRALERDRDEAVRDARRRWRAALDDFVVASKLHVDDVVDVRARRRGGGAAAAGAGRAGGRARRPARARAAVRGRARAGARAGRVAGVAAATSRARADDLADARGGRARRDAGGAGRRNRVRPACDAWQRQSRRAASRPPRQRRRAARAMNPARQSRARWLHRARVASRAANSARAREQVPLDRICSYSFLKRGSSGRSAVRSRLPAS